MSTPLYPEPRLQQRKDKRSVNTEQTTSASPPVLLGSTVRKRDGFSSCQSAALPLLFSIPFESTTKDTDQKDNLTRHMRPQGPHNWQ